MNWVDKISSIKTYHASNIDRSYIVNGNNYGIFVDSTNHGTGYYATTGKISEMVYGEWVAHNGKGAYVAWRKHPDGLPEYIELRPDGILGEWQYPRNGPERVSVTYMKKNKKVVRCSFPNGHILWWSFGLDRYNPLLTNFCKTPLDEIAYLVMMDEVKTSMDMVNFFGGTS